MKWNEFKKEWQKLEKSRKSEFVSSCMMLFSSMGIIFYGIAVWGQYSKELLDDNLDYALVGVMIFSMGTFLFNYSCYIALRNRIRRLEDGRE